MPHAPCPCYDPVVPAILFLHAFPLNRAMWQPQVEALPPGWTALAPDFRGFGGAPADDDPSRLATLSLDDYVADVLTEMNAQGIGRAVFCGCSMGGYTALALLRLSPERVAGLVLADTKATADTDLGLASRRAMLDLLDREGPGAVTAQMLPRLVGPTTAASRPTATREVAQLAANATAAGVRGAIIRMMNRPDSMTALAAFRGPVLVTVGAEDELTPVAEAERMAALVPGARLAVLPNAGHLANLETPDAFNAELRAFLSGLKPEA
jgi:3-oxoadipate enol-lactonase